MRREMLKIATGNDSRYRIQKVPQHMFPMLIILGLLQR